jgi:hypothetical protein
MKTENWKDVIGYEGLYQISNLGNVKSLNYNRTKKERILKKQTNIYGYYHITLSKNNKKITRTIHQLVATAFLDFKPCNMKLVINHKNFDRKDNNLKNLEIVSQRENANQKHIKTSSKYTGVNICKSTNKWMSRIYINGKRKYLGLFENEFNAHLAYQNALKKL